MSKYVTSRTALCNILCIALMLIILALHFTPFWIYAGAAEGAAAEATASIQGYIWFPNNYKELVTYFKTVVGEGYTIDAILNTALYTLILSIAGIALYLFKPEKIWTSLCALVLGGVGIWGYLASRVYALGVTWELHFLFYVVLLFLGLISCVLGLRDRAKEKE